MFNEIIQKIEENHQIKKSGKFNSIKLPFKRFSKYFPGFEKGKYYLATASSGIGKTKITKFLVITTVYEFCKKNNIKYKQFYFALEESVEDFWLSFISTYLKITYNLDLSVAHLKSVGDYELSEEHLDKIRSAESYVSDLMKYVEVHDNILNGFGIYKKVREYAINNGKFYFKDADGNEKEVTHNELHTHYKPNDPDEYVFVITDHLSLLASEKDFDTKQTLSHWDSMRKFSQEYCLNGFCKRFNYITFNVQQQDSQSQKKQFNMRGEQIEEKLLPSTSELADCKIIERDADVIFGLFAPARYDIEEYRGYNIKLLQDNYRDLIVLKDRWYGCANLHIPLYFDGASNIFIELPPKGTPELLEFYNKLKK